MLGLPPDQSEPPRPQSPTLLKAIIIDPIQQETSPPRTSTTSSSWFPFTTHRPQEEHQETRGAADFWTLAPRVLAGLFSAEPSFLEGVVTGKGWSNSYLVKRGVMSPVEGEGEVNASRGDVDGIHEVGREEEEHPPDDEVLPTAVASPLDHSAFSADSLTSFDLLTHPSVYNNNPPPPAHSFLRPTSSSSPIFTDNDTLEPTAVLTPETTSGVTSALNSASTSGRSSVRSWGSLKNIGAEESEEFEEEDEREDLGASVGVEMILVNAVGVVDVKDTFDAFSEKNVEGQEGVVIEAEDEVEGVEYELQDTEEEKVAWQEDRYTTETENEDGGMDYKGSSSTQWSRRAPFGSLRSDIIFDTGTSPPGLWGHGSLRRDETVSRAVRGGVLERLVDRLLEHADFRDVEFISTFILTHRTFMTSQTFFNVLLSRAAELPKVSASILTQGVHPIDVVLEVWVLQAWEDFEEDKTLTSLLFDFIDWRFESSLSESARRLKELVLKQKAKSSLSPSLHLQKPFLFRGEPNVLFHEFLYESVEGLVMGITKREAGLFAAIKKIELLRRDWSGNAESRILAKIQSFNALSYFVILSILMTKSLRTRVKMLKKHVKIAHLALVEYKNYDTAICIVSALQSAGVGRLKGTWKELSGKYRQMYLSVCRALDPQGNYKHLRANVREAGEDFCVPYLGYDVHTRRKCSHAESQRINIVLGFSGFKSQLC
ncbi:hypothetical protein HDV05_007430 [Chytridiales sp. JEL 0842]|nr:hypothetical protein HDV05_007430 [Chytridiales sp. JEL 0842]